MRLSKNDQELLSEAYNQVLENQPKTAKHISTSKAGHYGDMAVYELSPKLQETPTEWIGFTTDTNGKVTLIDPDSTMLDPIEVPQALQGVDFNKTSPEELLKKLGYTVADKNGQKTLGI